MLGSGVRTVSGASSEVCMLGSGVRMVSGACSEVCMLASGFEVVSDDSSLDEWRVIVM